MICKPYVIFHLFYQLKFQHCYMNLTYILSRFWNSGYWKSHLAGRRYHISALYVIDLKKFRKIAAGDRLRGQYQGLSHDPNSLANLDQDLPNNMIHQVCVCDGLRSCYISNIYRYKNSLFISKLSV